MEIILPPISVDVNMNIKTRILSAAMLLTTSLGLASFALPAQAATGDSKICNAAASYTYITARDIVSGASNNLVTVDDNGDRIGECTTYHNASNWRVDTDPQGSSHSYRIRYDIQLSTGSYELGDWHSCHDNSDNHSSDPQDPGSSGSNWRVVYQNFDGGHCTN